MHVLVFYLLNGVVVYPVSMRLACPFYIVLFHAFLFFSLFSLQFSSSYQPLLRISAHVYPRKARLAVQIPSLATSKGVLRPERCSNNLFFLSLLLSSFFRFSVSRHGCLGRKNRPKLHHHEPVHRTSVCQSLYFTPSMPLLTLVCATQIIMGFLQDLVLASALSSFHTQLLLDHQLGHLKHTNKYYE